MSTYIESVICHMQHSYSQLRVEGGTILVAKGEEANAGKWVKFDDKSYLIKPTDGLRIFEHNLEPVGYCLEDPRAVFDTLTQENFLVVGYLGGNPPVDFIWKQYRARIGDFGMEQLLRHSVQPGIRGLKIFDANTKPLPIGVSVTGSLVDLVKKSAISKWGLPIDLAEARASFGLK